MNSVLKAIQARPDLYFNRNDRLFTCLDAFLGGYQVGSAMAKLGSDDFMELVPSGFQKFVTEKFGEHFPASGKGWQWFIEQNTSSEREAFDLFFTLRQEYDQYQSGK
jgi:hypothetical protein